MTKWICSGLLLAACGATPDGEGGKTYYLGSASAADRYSAPSDEDIVAREIATAGLWLDIGPERAFNGFGLGYRRRALLAVPLDCRVVFRIENDAQLELAVEMTRDLLEGEDGLCIARD